MKSFSTMKPSKDTPKFKVTRRAVFEESYTVRAESVEEAITMLSEGRAHVIAQSKPKEVCPLTLVNEMQIKEYLVEEILE